MEPGVNASLVSICMLSYHSMHKTGKVVLTDLYGVCCDNCLALVNDCANAVMPVFANGFPAIVRNLHALLGRY